jgi:hypothetical protein
MMSSSSSLFAEMTGGDQQFHALNQTEMTVSAPQSPKADILPAARCFYFAPMYVIQGRGSCSRYRSFVRLAESSQTNFPAGS